MVGLLEGQDLIDFVDGSIEVPSRWINVPERDSGVLIEYPNPRFKDWRRTDRLVKGWITSRLTPSILTLITGIETTKGVWDALKSALAQDIVEREFLLREKLQVIKKESSVPIQDYINNYKSIFDELGLIGKVLGDEKFY